MKILAEELGKMGRWYIALPPLLLTGFLIGLYFLAASGQRRLTAANERVHSSEVREHALNEFLAVITDAESEQRGFLLTGDESYRESFAVAATQVQPTLRHLQAAYSSLAVPIEELPRLQVAVDQKMHELEETIALYHANLIAPAIGLARAKASKRTTQEILNLVAILRGKERVALSTATARSRSDLFMSRWITTGGAVLNIGLVILAAAMVTLDMRRRARQAQDLRGQRRELTRLVDARTRELTALSTHLQGVSEQEKSALSRELHDELGGLLVAARMDLSWLQQRLPTHDPAIEQRFTRIHESLSAGVDLKRRVVEELRPTLLDNMGLFTALRWQFKESCRRTGLLCSERIPETDLKFNPDAAIGVFRVAQEALMNIVKHADAKSATLLVEIQQETFLLQISDDGRGMQASHRPNSTSHGVASMKHRIAALGGHWESHTPVSGGTVVTARIPLRNMLPREFAVQASVSATPSLA